MARLEDLLLDATKVMANIIDGVPTIYIVPDTMKPFSDERSVYRYDDPESSSNINEELDELHALMQCLADANDLKIVFVFPTGEPDCVAIVEYVKHKQPKFVDVPTLH